MTKTIDITESNAATGPNGGLQVADAASNAVRRASQGVPLFVPADQLYYWSYAWRESERKAMADLRAGRAHTFDDPMAAVRYLLGSDR
ncbi:MAG: hypothetical protein ACRDL4_02065 [Thermoleophilaceae bacterium]